MKKRGLPFFLTILTSILSMLLAALIDELFQSNGMLTAAALFAAVVWLLFVLRRVIIGFPDKVPLELLSNVLLVIMLAAHVLALIFGAGFFFSAPTEERFSCSMLFSSVLTFALALYASHQQPSFPVSKCYLIPLLMVPVSAIGGLLVPLMGSLAFIAGIVLLVFSLVSTIVLFKKDYVSFESLSTKTRYHSSYYGGYSSSYSSSFDTTPATTTHFEEEDPEYAMERICSKVDHTRTLVGTICYYPDVTCSCRGGTVVFTIGGSLSTAMGDYSARDVQYALQRAVRELRGDIEYYHGRTLERLQKQGVDCSDVSRVRIVEGRISC